MQYAFGPTIGAGVNITLLTYVNTCALGIDVDTAAIPDYDVFYECLWAVRLGDGALVFVDCSDLAPG